MRARDQALRQDRAGPDVDLAEDHRGSGDLGLGLVNEKVIETHALSPSSWPLRHQSAGTDSTRAWYEPETPLSYRGRMTAWGDLPPALPPHGTVLAWARGCRCEACEYEYQRFVSGLALRGPLRLPAQPEPRKLDADTLARLEPAVSQSECPVCGALRHQRCRNLAFPQHFAPTRPERGSGP
jgi:hypothetical protein